MSLTPPWCDPRFNLTDKMIDAIAYGWRQLLHDNGLEIVATEAECVNDDLRLAGTLDRLVRTTRPILFDGITIPEGVVSVLDIKTSKLYPDLDGLPSYWSGYPLQLYAYATSRPYDTATDTRSDWDFPIDQTHALIAHLDIDKLMADHIAVWQLIYVDLDVARQGVEALQAAKAYHAADKFTLNHHITKVEAGTTTTAPSRRDLLLERYAALNDAGKEMWSMLGIDRDDLDAIEEALDNLDPFNHVAMTVQELEQYRVDTITAIVDAAPEHREIRRLILATVTETTDHKQWTETECRQLNAIVAAFGDVLGLKYTDDGPELVGPIAAVLAAA